VLQTQNQIVIQIRQIVIVAKVAIPILIVNRIDEKEKNRNLMQLTKKRKMIKTGKKISQGIKTKVEINQGKNLKKQKDTKILRKNKIDKSEADQEVKKDQTKIKKTTKIKIRTKILKFRNKNTKQTLIMIKTRKNNIEK
jgi:hypothetical protein